MHSEKSPYVLHPVSQRFPNVAFEPVPLFIWSTMAQCNTKSQYQLIPSVHVFIGREKLLVNVWCQDGLLMMMSRNSGMTLHRVMIFCWMMCKNISIIADIYLCFQGDLSLDDIQECTPSVTFTCVSRVIFRWMTSKNMYTISFKEGAKAGSPEEVLLSFKNKQGTYARIFETLCR